MWGLSHKSAKIRKFKYKVWNFLQTPHISTFYRYFWMGLIFLGDFRYLQVPCLGPMQAPKVRCLVPLQIINDLPLNFCKCWVSKSPVWTSQIILGIHSSIRSTGTLNQSLSKFRLVFVMAIEWISGRGALFRGSHPPADLCQRKRHWPHAGPKALQMLCCPIHSAPVYLFHGVSFLISSDQFPFHRGRTWTSQCGVCLTKELTVNSLMHCHKTNGLF